MTPTDALKLAKEALETMPDFLGTPETSAHKRSLEIVAKWYCRYYGTVRKALEAEKASGGDMTQSKRGRG